MSVSLYIDQNQTFARLVFLSSEPKMAFGNSEKQDTTKSGVPKWEVQVAATFKQFGKLRNEILKVSVLSHSDPGDAIEVPQSVEMTGFRVHVNPVDRRVENGTERINGGTAVYQADGIRLADPSL
ncbi:hypothetical protein [Streptomyces wedmorensis]